MQLCTWSDCGVFFVCSSGLSESHGLIFSKMRDYLLQRKRYTAYKKPYAKRYKKGSLVRDVSVMKRMMRLNRNVGRIDVSVELPAHNTGEVQCLNLIAGGTDDNERLGNKITLISYQYRFQVPQPLNADAAQVVAWYLVYDRQTNGANPPINDYLEAINSRVFPNWEYKDRFVTLRSWHRLAPTPNSTVATAQDGQSGQGYIKFKGEITQYQAQTAAIANVITGGLFLVVVGDDAESAGDNPILLFQGRLVFSQ